ncbi:hypothetical protein BU15DRAFT_66206 [Melanogaster broomeanus]|nr:hypothetical protein BU15DRAFT_66206 [Melanogaster broomeanus]
MRAHSEGAAPDVQGGAQRRANSTRTGQRHDASAHGEGRCTRAEWPSSMHEWNGSTRVPEGIIEGPGGRTDSTMPDSPLSMPLEGERGHQPSSGYADDGTIARVHQAQLEAQQGYLEAKETRQDKVAAQSPRDCIHMPHDANDGGGTHRGPRQAQCKGEQSPMVPIEREDDGMPVQQCRKDRRRKQRTRRLQNRPEQLWHRQVHALRTRWWSER